MPEDFEHFDGWMNSEQNAALAEGWLIVECGDGQIVIEADADCEDWDPACPHIDAYCTVLQRAKAGSALHAKAIAITDAEENIARQHQPEDDDFWTADVDNLS